MEPRGAGRGAGRTLPPGPPVVLCIAGLDSSAGGGLAMDVKVCQALGVHAAAAATAVTAQDTTGVHRVHAVPPTLVGAQIDAAARDFRVAACKIGMLHGPRTVEVVEARLRRRGLESVVLDPVLLAKDGTPLLHSRGMEAMRRRLLKRCAVVLPNAPEAAALTGMTVETREQAREAARRLVEMGAAFALVKGGHLSDGNAATDILTDGSETWVLSGPRREGPPVRGTGCMLSSALAAYLALGRAVPEAAEAAKRFVAQALEGARPLGRGSLIAASLPWSAEP